MARQNKPRLGRFHSPLSERVHECCHGWSLSFIYVEDVENIKRAATILFPMTDPRPSPLKLDTLIISLPLYDQTQQSSSRVLLDWTWITLSRKIRQAFSSARLLDSSQPASFSRPDRKIPSDGIVILGMHIFHTQISLKSYTHIYILFIIKKSWSASRNAYTIVVCLSYGLLAIIRWNDRKQYG